MGKGTDKLAKSLTKLATEQSRNFQQKYGQQVMDLLELPVKIVFSPFTLAFDIAGSAPRGFGIPELASKISFTAIFAVATLGTYDIVLELGRKVICPRNCKTCSGWQALRCTMCKGTGTVHYRVKNYSLRSGERATAESVAEAITENRAELVHLPSALDLSTPLPSKDCPSCDGTGVMGCPECKNRLQVRISADNIMEPPWKAYNVWKKMDYPYEKFAMTDLTIFYKLEDRLRANSNWIQDDFLNRWLPPDSLVEYEGFKSAYPSDLYPNIINSMKDPKIAAFWLITMPQALGGFTYDDEVKQKIWWAYEESMRYDQLRDVVAKRKPGWENLQKGLIALDPIRARDDPVIIKNIPYYKAKKALEAEVMKLDVPPRPQNWGDLDLPLSESSWTKEELKDPKKLLEMTTLLNAQREFADRSLDAQWEAKWREDKLNALLEEKLKPYIQHVSRGLPQSIVMQPNDQKKTTRHRWWFF